MTELSWTQDEECSDGTTSVIIFGAQSLSLFFFRFPLFPLPLFPSPTTPHIHPAGEILAQSLSELERDIHPAFIISAYNKALAEALSIIQRISVPIGTTDNAQMLSLITMSVSAEFVARWSDMYGLALLSALLAVMTVTGSHGHGVAGAAAGEDGGGQRHTSGQTSVNIKRYAHVEKIPGSEMEESRVLSDILHNKDITHPAMWRCIILLDCPPGGGVQEGGVADEYGVQQGGRLGTHAGDREGAGEGTVFPTSRTTDLTQHIFVQANVSALRRMRKSDNSRIALAVGAIIVNRIEDIRESNVGMGSGLFRVEKIGDECVFFLFLFYFWVLFLLLLLFFISPGLPCVCVCGFGFHLSTLAFFTSFFNFLFLFFGSILGDQCLRLFSLAIPLVLSFDIRACVRTCKPTVRFLFLWTWT
ncbi:hypothetical protein CVT25_015009 [Psilocybe cyanescens]|uniref:Uncharacterized protein n=1 Tax=Psilocybe cyanescens TaxID=93625 RepID=A0A409XAG7_PSICY|nr:hypothetical protein CVT25_015009 [Psilocybe cyanescens]